MAHPARIKTPVLDVAYEQSGPDGALPVLLLHGFPYDPRGFDEVVAIVNAAGFRTVVPYLRGYGGTRFLSADTLRRASRPRLDRICWSCSTRFRSRRRCWRDMTGAAARPAWCRRCGRSASQGLSAAPATISRTYRIQPSPPIPRRRRGSGISIFHTERGRSGLIQKRREISRLLWKMWSPTSAFDDATFERTAASFDNEDFVDVVIHSYRHRFGSVAGDPRYAPVEAQLAAQPNIGVPAIVLHGADDGVIPHRGSEGHGKHFTGPYQRRVLAGVGHNPPQEAPQAFAEAVLELCRNVAA